MKNYTDVSLEKSKDPIVQWILSPKTREEISGTLTSQPLTLIRETSRLFDKRPTTTVPVPATYKAGKDYISFEWVGRAFKVSLKAYDNLMHYSLVSVSSGKEDKSNILSYDSELWDIIKKDLKREA